MGLIYVDSCLVIYLVENHPRWNKPVSRAMAQAGDQSFALSPLVKCECLVGPMRRADLVLQRAYTDFFEQFAPLPMHEAVFVQAAQLRASFGVKTPDALHLACAQYHGCDALWTNDDRLARASLGLARNILD